MCCGPGEGFTRLWMARGRFRCWLGHTRQMFCGDQVIEEADVQVFLQPDAAAALDDKALDAQISQDGEVSFVIQRQA